MKKNSKIIKKYTAVYYRISKKAKNNIWMQKKVCTNYCLNNKIKRVKEYSDKGFSGKIKKRPALIKLLNDLKEKKINSVLVYKIDRLGRNFSYLNEVIETFDKKGVKLISATQNFDTFTPEGKFMLRLLMGLAEFESGMISNRTIDGLLARNKKKSRTNTPQE